MRDVKKTLILSSSLDRSCARLLLTCLRTAAAEAEAAASAVAAATAVAVEAASAAAAVVDLVQELGCNSAAGSESVASAIVASASEV